MYACKIGYEQSPGNAFHGPLHSLGLSHEPHEQIVLIADIEDLRQKHDSWRDKSHVERPGPSLEREP
jgi:hypothetical protein